MSKHIYIYDGITLDQQLDKRCQDILAKRVRIDPTPPSILTNTPSISLPKSLSCLIPSPNLSNGRVSPGIGHDSIRNNHSPMSGTTTPTTPTSNIDDPRVWLSILIKYLETDIQRICEKLFQSSYKIYIYFDIPDYSVFKLIHLKSDDEFDETIHPQQSQQQQQQPHENPLLESNEYQELKINQTRHSLAIISKSETRTQGDYDRSISLDSGHGNSPLKKHNTGPGTGTGTRLNSELQLGTSLFNEDNSLNDNEMKTKPPIPLSHTSTSPRPGNYQSIEDLRLALQTNPNKQKAKKKSIFGWGNSS